MSERTEAQIAASIAETERQRDLNKKRQAARDKYLKTKKTAAARSKDAKVRGASDLDSSDMRNAWLFYYLGDANYGEGKASKLAGYAESSWSTMGARNKRHFSQQIADHFESHGFGRSDAIALNIRTIRGFSLCAVYHEDEDRYGKLDIIKTVNKLREEGFSDLIVGYKHGEPVFLDAEKAIDRLTMMGGFNAPIKIDLANVPRAELESEGQSYLRELATMAMIDGAIDADYANDTATADEIGD